MASYGTYNDFYLTVRNKKKNSERMTSPPRHLTNSWFVFYENVYRNAFLKFAIHVFII